MAQGVLPPAVWRDPVDPWALPMCTTPEELIIDNDETYTNGRKIQDFRRTGYFATSNADSPLYDATIELLGSWSVTAEGEREYCSVCFAIVDPKGNACWGDAGFDFIGGQKAIKFSPRAGIAELAKLCGDLVHAFPANGSTYDGHDVVGYEFSYEFAEHEVVKHHRNSYKNTAKGFSTHGPHMRWYTKPLAGDLQLEVSLQEGVTLTDVEGSPMYRCRYYGMGFAIQNAVTGRTYSHCMPNRYADDDGDILWLGGQWWYDEGRGCDYIVHATGKWEDTKMFVFYGEGIEPNIARVDNVYICNFELEWESGGWAELTPVPPFLLTVIIRTASSPHHDPKSKDQSATAKDRGP